jgi:hypothetical protein
MPQIREYQSKVAVAGPVGGRAATGEDFGAGIGQGLRALGAGIMDGGEILLQAAERDDVSIARRLASEKRFRWGVALNERKRASESTIVDSGAQVGVQAPTVGADGKTMQVNAPDITSAADIDLAYPDFAEKYVTEMDDDLLNGRNVLKTAAGRQVYDEMTTSLRTDLGQQAYFAQIDLAGKKAAVDVRIMLDNMRNSVMASPSSLPSVVNEFVQSMQYEQNLPADVRDKIMREGRTSLAKSAVQGEIDADPVAAVQIIREGKYDRYLDADDKAQLMKTAEVAIRADELERDRQTKKAKEAFKLEQQKVQDDFLAKYAEGELTAKEVLASNLDPFGDGSKKQFLAMLESQAKDGPTFATDPGTYHSLFERIHLPYGHPQRINDESQLFSYHRRLTPPDMERLRGDVRNNRDREGATFQQDKAKFVKSMEAVFKPNKSEMPDPRGELNFYNWQHALDQEILAKQQKGEDPRVLLNPNHKEYYGLRAGEYQRTQIEILRDLPEYYREQYGTPGAGEHAKNNPEAAAKKQGFSSSVDPSIATQPPMEPNESPEAYLVRVRKWREGGSK